MIRSILCIMLCMCLCGCGSSLFYYLSDGKGPHATYYAARNNIPVSGTADGSSTIIDRSNSYSGSYNAGPYTNYGAYTGAISGKK